MDGNDVERGESRAINRADVSMAEHMELAGLDLQLLSSKADSPAAGVRPATADSFAQTSNLAQDVKDPNASKGNVYLDMDHHRFSNCSLGPQLSLTRDESSQVRKPVGLHVSFESLSYTVMVGKGCCNSFPLKLLDRVTGYFPPGEMTALMGPSGCGKTTLLDVISGRKNSGHIEGEVLYGATPASQSFLRRSTGYVEQFDTLVDNLTVREMLRYTAAMKLPRTHSRDEKDDRVEAIIAKMSLERCQDTIIGNSSKRGISGGQCKRVNIAVSILTDPLVLYLDEPTSGLDSFTADEVMSYVHKLCKDGITVCATIHSPSPSTFQLFGRLLLLLAGRVVYFGSNGDACVRYFMGTAGLMPVGTSPPERWQQAEWIVEFTTDAGNKGRRDELASLFQSSLYGSKIEQRHLELRALYTRDGDDLTVEALEKDDPRKGKSTSVPTWYAIQQMFWFRTLRNYKDPMFLSARVVDKFIAGGIVMSLFHGRGGHSNIKDQTQLAAALFMWATQPAFSSAGYIPTIMLERQLYLREINDGLYLPLTYYVTKWIQEILLAIPVTLIFCGCIYGALSLTGNFFIWWIAYYLAQMTSIAVAFTFATLCPTIDFANGAVPSFGGTLLFFVGFLIPLNQIPAWWIWYSYFDYLRYTYVSMMVNEFDQSSYTNTEFTCQNQTYAGVLAYYGMEDQAVWWNLLALFGYWVFFTLSAFACLIIINWGRR